MLDEKPFGADTPYTAVVSTEIRQEEGEQVFYDVPEKLNVFQYICLGLLYLVLAFMVGFIIYISCTWNKVRPNEYIWIEASLLKFTLHQKYWLL